jgi:hypothetical protein
MPSGDAAEAFWLARNVLFLSAMIVKIRSVNGLAGWEAELPVPALHTCVLPCSLFQEPRSAKMMTYRIQDRRHRVNPFPLCPITGGLA